ncbi:MAG: hypothetical protein KGD66_10405, partial [Candidatus Lokiarchaeota archaeon]|nr:hypothetical protein [Candidatus Lokiarchaeota archaeon]
IWVAVMLCYLLGDVLRIFSGEFTPGEIEGKPMTQSVVFGMALIMVIPIIMVVLTIILDNPINSWVNIIVAIIFIVFNLVGMKGMKTFDKFLIIVSFGLNGLTVWYALTRLLL